jgi:phospholipid transport system substrate-binding protein
MDLVRKLLAAGVAASIGFGAPSAAAQQPAPAAPRPDVLMSTLTSEVLAVIRRDATANRPTDFALLVESRILPVFDFEHMTRIAMARNWRLASHEQQAALVAQFRTLLVRTYSSALSNYRDEAVEYKPLRISPEETDVLVRSVVRRRGVEPLTIDYDMERTPGGWKVYDVKIAGVSMVLTYRETFAAAVRAGGIDGLIKSLAERNRQNEAAPDRAQGTMLAPVLMLYSGGKSGTASVP